MVELGKKTIGILGGMGPEATADLFYRIIKTTPVERDQDHFHVIIDSNPNIEDRTPAITGSGPSPLPLMIESGKNLEVAGSDFLIMPCNTAHFFYDDLQKELGVPLLHMIKLCVDYTSIKYPRVKKVGLLATDGTIASKLYHDAYKNKGIVTITPSNESQSHVMDTIYKSIKKGNLEKGKEVLLRVANELIDVGIDALVCGCTEVSIVLNNSDMCLPLIDPLQILAEEAIKIASS
jgi:aspartate racemase